VMKFRTCSAHQEWNSGALEFRLAFKADRSPRRGRCTVPVQCNLVPFAADAEGILLSTKKDQAPPDLTCFKPSKKCLRSRRCPLLGEDPSWLSCLITTLEVGYLRE